MLTKRVEILLEPAEMEMLRRHAGKTGKSVGSLIREAVKEKYMTPSYDERMAALARLLDPEREVSFPSWRELKAELADSMRRRVAID
jgi:hypothetical protein